MFDIGFPELVLVAIVGLLVIGPERLPEALRTLGLWLGRMRRSFVTVKTEIEKEIGMDEIRRQLHNEAIMEEMKRIEEQVKGTVDDARSSLNEGANAIDPKAPETPSLEPAQPQPEPNSDSTQAQQPAEDSAETQPEQVADYAGAGAPEQIGNSVPAQAQQAEDPPRVPDEQIEASPQTQPQPTTESGDNSSSQTRANNG